MPQGLKKNNVELITEDVEFGVSGQAIRGTLYVPTDRAGNLPAVAFAHGWGMVAGGDLEGYAKVVASRGFVCLTFDFRNLGRSDGIPRQEILPYSQVDDYRDAITFLEARADVDSSRIGVWGSSYSGGHVLVVAAIDKRVACVVSQVPTISGFDASLRRNRPDDLISQRALFNQDRLARLEGAEPTYIQTVGVEGEHVAYPGAESREYMIAESLRTPEWRNETTLRSVEAARGYEPGEWASRIGPVPLLMIVGSNDVLTPTDMQLDAYAWALEPKRLLIVDGGHYSVYQEHFEATSGAAAEWFTENL